MLLLVGRMFQIFKRKNFLHFYFLRFATEDLKKLNMKKIVKPTSKLHVGNIPVRYSLIIQVISFMMHF